MAVAVVTDSAAGLTPDLQDRWGIHVVDLHVLVDGVEYDGISPIDYGSSAVTTSGASPAEFAAAYERAFAASNGDGVVAVLLSGKLSATCAAAEKAADSIEIPAQVVDSLSAGVATGYSALAAARAAAVGAPLAAVAATAKDLATRMRSFVMVDRLEQLRRGGRISTAAAFFGTALVTKPVLRLAGGKLELLEKARTRSKAYTKLASAVARAAGDSEALIAVQHLQAADRASELASRLADRVPGVRTVPVTEFGPVLGAHLGSGAVGVVVVPGGLKAAGTG